MRWWKLLNLFLDGAGFGRAALFSALAQRLGHGGYAATLLVASTVAAFFTVNAWIWLVTQVLVA